MVESIQDLRRTLEPPRIQGESDENYQRRLGEWRERTNPSKVGRMIGGTHGEASIQKLRRTPEPPRMDGESEENYTKRVAEWRKQVGPQSAGRAIGGPHGALSVQEARGIYPTKK